MKVAIVGASGVMDQEFLRVLEQRKFLLDGPVLFDSQRSASTTYSFRGKDHEVKLLWHSDDFKDIDIAFVSAGGGTSKEFADAITEHDTMMVDNSSVLHMDEDVPLMVSEMSAEDVLKRPCNAITNSSCITIMMAVTLEPIDDLSRIKRVCISFYQSTSGTGTATMVELQQQYKELVEAGSMKTISRFPHQLACNVIPQIDAFMDNGYTREEMKMFNKTRKIMYSDIKTSVTCVRASSLRLYSESVWLEIRCPLSAEEVRQAIATAPGCVVRDGPTQALHPMSLESAGHDNIYVDGIRKDLVDDSGMTLWLTGDQIRKGAAPNAVQIAGYLIKVGNMKWKAEAYNHRWPRTPYTPH